MKKNLNLSTIVVLAAIVVIAFFSCNNGEAKKEAVVDSPKVTTDKPAEVSKPVEPGDTLQHSVDSPPTRGGGKNPPPPKS
jgi:hypothetical protein